MLKDFYFSATYDRLERKEKGYLQKQIFINGKYVKYSFYVDAGTKFNNVWEDTIYVGTSDDVCCKNSF